MTRTTNPTTGVEVKLGFFPLAFFLFFCAPTVEVDGKPQRLSWGTHFIGLPPGRHTLKIFFGYLFMPECGANSIDIGVREGNVSKVEFYMPPWMMAKGSLKEV